ncbi:unnamed protein product [Paramecium primaurelia]|uniref:WD40-repeat-containing domain n=1 Tax=Paramecium primaurelia TaxID=5886 RepID=A0A8S1MB21_PARPR|nr:unnamed protein product [Paramecium primaurelia]
MMSIQQDQWSCYKCQNLMLDNYQQAREQIDQEIKQLLKVIQNFIASILQISTSDFKVDDQAYNFIVNKQAGKKDFYYKYCLYFEICQNYINRETKQLIESLNKFLIEVQKIHPHNFIQENVNQEEKKAQKNNWQMVDKKDQQELCCCLAFNNNSTFLIAGAQSSIKLWKFAQGQLIEESLILYGHEKPVTCLVFHKNQDFFISGSEDCTLRVWRKQWVQNWISKSYKISQQEVLGVLLDEQSNQVISWSKENIIKIYLLFNKDELKQIQILIKHKSNIDCVCMDQTSKILCSSGSDKQLIIWKKNQQTECKTKNDNICRMTFLNETLVCVYWTEGIVQPFQLKDDKYVEKLELYINLNSQCDGEILFPCIYNKQQNILIMKHYKYIYIFNSNLVQCSIPIECQDYYCYGALSNDAKYLAIWDDSSKMIRIYQNPQL